MEESPIEFRLQPCPVCNKQPGIRKNITDKLPTEDPQRYAIRCCIGEAYGISETQVIYNWNKTAQK